MSLRILMCGFAGMQGDTMRTIPESLVPQVARLVHSLCMIVGDDIAVLVHGSVALGDYQPGRSDLDVLVFCDGAATKRQHVALATAMLDISGLPAPIELSVIDRALLNEWVHPAPFYFHYSEDWRESTRAALADDTHIWEHERTDADLSAHMVIAHHHGIMVYGDAIVPLPTPQQALAAVWYDIASAETQVDEAPDYVILNLCRTIRWLEHGEVHSKGSGGTAMVPELTEPARSVVVCMCALRRGEEITMPDADVLRQVARMLLGRIHAQMT
ncbi:MAG: aminoglycoside adenylyltransferase domain-containing protein [Chloroflexota bacterium]|jgi:predicted nucleotidyltransferase